MKREERRSCAENPTDNRTGPGEDRGNFVNIWRKEKGFCHELSAMNQCQNYQDIYTVGL